MSSACRCERHFPTWKVRDIELLDQVFRSGESFYGKNTRIIFQKVPGGKLESHLVDFVYQPVRNANGDIAAIFVDGMDRTTRHPPCETTEMAREKLRKLNANLLPHIPIRADVKSRSWALSSYLLGALNDQGYFETANPAWETVLGWTVEEVTSRPMFELMHPGDVARSRSSFQSMQYEPATLTFVNRYRHKDGSYRWISWVGIVEDGYVYCTGRDVTAEQIVEK